MSSSTRPVPIRRPVARVILGATLAATLLSATTTGLGAADDGVLDLLHGSVGMTMAADGADALHVAASAAVGTGGALSAVYARCTDLCTRPASWSAVVLGETSAGHVPTIALTDDGRPRIAYDVGTGSSPGLHYAECDDACLDVGHWHDVWLADTLSINPFPRPRLPFAVSAGGAAAYAFDDGTGLQLLSCASSCASGAGWARTQIAGPFIVPEALAFGPDEGLQVVARQRRLETESLLFLDCPADCADARNWNGVIGLWTATGEIQAQIARTTTGGSRIAVYADDPATQPTERVLVFLACDVECVTPSRWQPALLLPIAAAAADVGYGLTLDATDNPILAYADEARSAISRCRADCTSTAGRWDTTPSLSGQDLDATDPITVPPSCDRTGWAFYSGPALTIVDGAPVSTLTASAKAFGGRCDPGTTLDTVSFVDFAP